MNNGKLTVTADNSDLAQILRDLAGISGMKLKGLNGGPRIFGVYGPGDSRDVLSALLIGSGYNFVMVGGAPGSTPGELILTTQNKTDSALTPPSASPSDQAEAPLTEFKTDPSETIEAGSGAITPAPSQNDLDDNTRVQTTLQRLQQMQEQQETAPK
jgi:hypothetical protein